MTLTEFKNWEYTRACILIGTKRENRQILAKLVEFTESRLIDIHDEDDGEDYIYIALEKYMLREKLTEEFLANTGPFYVYIPTYSEDIWEELTPTPGLNTLVKRTIQL